MASFQLNTKYFFNKWRQNSMNYLARELHISRTGLRISTNFQKAHGQCGGFLNTTFKEKSLKLYRLKLLMPTGKKARIDLTVFRWIMKQFKDWNKLTIRFKYLIKGQKYWPWSYSYYSLAFCWRTSSFFSLRGFLY